MGSANTLTRRNPLAATEEITLATETSGPQITELLPSQIYIDAGLQTRDKVDQGKIAEYAEAMANGDQFPPLLVYRIGTEQGYLLVKGFHRFNAHIAAFDQKPIRCKITHGSRRDALKEALGDNADHGLPLNREDKRKKIKIALADAEWGQWSDREIAKLCKVSHPLVAEVRREVTGNSSSDLPRTYTTKHGTQATMKTERISQANSARSSNAAADDAGMPFAPRTVSVFKADPADPNSADVHIKEFMHVLPMKPQPAPPQPAADPPPAPSLTPPAAPTPQPGPVAPAGSGDSAQSRSQRLNHLVSHYRLLIDLLPDYGELTGDYPGTLAFRRAVEPMIRKLEENLV